MSRRDKKIIARHFQCRVICAMESGVPAGTTEIKILFIYQSSLRDSHTLYSPNPGTEVPRYSHCVPEGRCLLRQAPINTIAENVLRNAVWSGNERG